MVRFWAYPIFGRLSHSLFTIFGQKASRRRGESSASIPNSLWICSSSAVEVSTFLRFNSKMEEKSKVLIIGATGFLGFHLAQASCNFSHPTFALIRDSTSSSSTKLDKLRALSDAGVQFLKVCLFLLFLNYVYSYCSAAFSCWRRHWFWVFLNVRVLWMTKLAWWKLLIKLMWSFVLFRLNRRWTRNFWFKSSNKMDPLR